jgi:GTPase
MASIFTYDPDVPRVSSPWLTPTDSPKPSTPQPKDRSAASTPLPSSGELSNYGVTRLEAEPQDGPTEYKLHLLLRPRRTYSSSTTGTAVDRSRQHTQQRSSQSPPNSSTPVLAPSNQSRQNRLEQLTTQLLWRLQQSSPYHASSTSDLVLPKLPEAASSLEKPSRPGKPLAGLEESRGALYEIGVSDDGTLVGLTKDEMDESLTNLRAMAASLGCNLKVVRMIVVGECEWQESATGTETSPRRRSKGDKRRAVVPTSPENIAKPFRHQAQLWVAEALVTPDLSSRQSFQAISPAPPPRPETETPPPTQLIDFSKQFQRKTQATEQLRVTLTGPTTSGKSSLLGTLSTATFDNGRGKSRLSLLKHRHEIASGVTSSVAQELLGYKGAEVKNYASGNISSWTDIHASAENGRLVFVSDAAGHPKYRRTTVRGLVGWAPHWNILCIAADDGDNAPSGAGGTSSAQDILGTDGSGVDLAKAHLALCLKLDKPLAIIITKLDLASKSGLRQTMAKILSDIKGANRTPSIFPPDHSKTVLESDLATLLERDDTAVQDLVDRMTVTGSLTSVVPILMTSAAKGTGIRSMHALLRGLPVPPPPTSHDFIGPVLNPEQPACLFHVEDVFGVPASYESLASKGITSNDTGVVVAGYSRFGKVSVGDTIVVGPFPAEAENDGLPPSQPETKSSPVSFGMSLSHISSAELVQITSRNAASASVTKGEWHSAHIVSMRHLRLPIHTLEAGQVGTIGIVFDLPEEELSNGPFERPARTAPRVRKGMVLAIPSRHMIETGHTLQTASCFTASFLDSDVNSITTGSLVVVYIASVRASAKVLRICPHEENGTVARFAEEKKMDEAEEVFGLDEEVEEEAEGPVAPIFGSDGVMDLTFEFLTNREWIELGSQILVMPGGGHGLYHGTGRGEKGVAGLEGFVGKVVEVVD